MKMEDMIIQSRLPWYGMPSVETSTPKCVRLWSLKLGKKGRPRKSWEECVKKDLERYDLRKEDRDD